MNTLFILKCHHCLESESTERTHRNHSGTTPHRTATGCKAFLPSVSGQFLFSLIWFKSEVFFLSKSELALTLVSDVSNTFPILYVHAKHRASGLPVPHHYQIFSNVQRMPTNLFQMPLTVFKCMLKAAV